MVNVINKPTHPRRAFKNSPEKPPKWWGGTNWIRNKKYGSGRKHKFGRRKEEMVRDAGSR